VPGYTEPVSPKWVNKVGQRLGLGLIVSLVWMVFCRIVCLTRIAFQENIIGILRSLVNLAEAKKCDML
jgi:hypothetical protein